MKLDDPQHYWKEHFKKRLCNTFLCFQQDGSGKITPKLLGTVLQCCGFLETLQVDEEKKSKWGMFDLPAARKRRESRWDAFDENLFAEVRRRSSICDIAPDQENTAITPNKNLTSIVKDVKIEEDKTRVEEEEKQNAIIREMMGLIDRTNTGMVEFPEFIETITVKILKDAVTAKFKGELFIIKWYRCL